MLVYDKQGSQHDLVEHSEYQNGNDYVKFPNGTMFCFGTCGASENSASTTVNFPISFVGRPTIIVTPSFTFDAKCIVTISNVTSSNCVVYLTDEKYGTTKRRIAYYLAIGTWK